MGAFPPLNDRNKADRLVIVLGDQLDPTIGPVATATDDDVVLMMEADEESTHVPSHKQRTALFLSAMRHFAVDQADRGRRVRYVEITDSHNTHSFEGEIRRAIEACRPESVHVTHPGDWRVMKMLEALDGDLDIPVEIHPDDPLERIRNVFNGLLHDLA